MNYYLGIDIGGSSIKYGIESCEQGLLLYDAIPIKDKNLHAFQGIVATILTRVSNAFPNGKISAIGIGTPGQIDHRKGIIIGKNPNLPFWTELSPACIIPAELNIPVLYDNDANLMALAEAQYFPADHNVIGVTIGSGIGCGFTIKRRVFNGSRGFALELGHVCSVYNGALCNCGKSGCLEAYCSLNGMRNRLVENGIAAQNWHLYELLASGNDNPTVAKVITEGIHHFAIALANLIVVLEPDHLVFGGGGSEIDIYPLQELILKIKSLLPAELADVLSFSKAKSGNKAGVLGAIALAKSYFLQ